MKRLVLGLFLGAACAAQPHVLGGHRVLEDGQLRFVDPTYDGHELSGWLLVAGDEQLVVDRRLPEGASLSVRKVERCAGGAIPFDIADTSLEAPTKDELLRVGSGFTYGKQVRLLVFATDGPPCIVVSLGLRDHSRVNAGEHSYLMGRFRFEQR